MVVSLDMLENDGAKNRKKSREDQSLPLGWLKEKYQENWILKAGKTHNNPRE